MNERLNNDMFGKQPNYVKPLIAAAIVIILLLVVMVSAVKADRGYLPHWAEDAHQPAPNACRTYPFGGYDMTSGILCDTGNNQDEEVKHSKDNQQDVTVTSTPIPYSPPAVIPTNQPIDQPTDTPSKDDKECKNKNSGKDGTPSECNAGKGQEKNQSTAGLFLYIMYVKYNKTSYRRMQGSETKNIFSLRKYFRGYDKSLLTIGRYLNVIDIPAFL